jgi:hypothetical protein
MEATQLSQKLDSISHVNTDYHPSVLADIYQENCNLATWQRHLNSELSLDIKQLVSAKALFNLRSVLKPNDVLAWLSTQWKDINCDNLINDISQLSTMYADLFELEYVGLRLELVNKTVCPYFHIDKVVSRLVTTYFGPATEWLTEDNSNRFALQQRQYAAIVKNEKLIKQANIGDVMLFKGDNWEIKNVKPIIHRSPACQAHQRRLLLTLDMM